MQSFEFKGSLTLPIDFIRALKTNPGTEAAFNALSYSHQKEYITWIEQAKKDTTRQIRIEKVIQRLIEGIGLS